MERSAMHLFPQPAPIGVRDQEPTASDLNKVYILHSGMRDYSGGTFCRTSACGQNMDRGIFYAACIEACGREEPGEGAAADWTDDADHERGGSKSVSPAFIRGQIVPFIPVDEII